MQCCWQPRAPTGKLLLLMPLSHLTLGLCPKGAATHSTIIRIVSRCGRSSASGIVTVTVVVIAVRIQMHGTDDGAITVVLIVVVVEP